MPSLGSILLVLSTAVTAEHATPKPQSVPSRRLTPAELASAKLKLNTSIIPGYNGDLGLEPQAQQAFAITGPGGLRLWLIPVSYDVDRAPQGMLTHVGMCGLFTLRSDGGLSFVETYESKKDSLNQCSSTSAIGFVPTSAGHAPRVIVLTKGQIKPSMEEHFPAPDMKVLRWDTASKAYVEDTDIEARLDKGQYPDKTIADVRRAILSLDAAKRSPAPLK